MRDDMCPIIFFFGERFLENNSSNSIRLTESLFSLISFSESIDAQVRLHDLSSNLF